MRRLLLWFLVIVAAATAGGYTHLQEFSAQPLVLPTKPFQFTVQPGQNLRQTARKLTTAGLLREPWRLLLVARLFSDGNNIKAGEYEFDEALTPLQLIEKLAKGDVKQVSVTFIEGHSFAQFRRALDQNPDLKHDTTQLDDVALLKLVGAAETHPEGLFFPDTYQFHKGASDVEILKRAYQTMHEHLAKLWDTRSADAPIKSPYEALVLASVVEKETGQAAERPQIAAVFSNRLRINMRLQSDPTVIYGLGATFTGNLTKEHLRSDTPYNSYTRNGLPPTPIAAPSLDAIKAVLNPAKGPWLYFVARGDGTHQFSNSLVEHNRAVAQFQK